MHRLLRLLTIVGVIARYRLDQLDPAAPLWLRAFIHLHPAAWRADTSTPVWQRAQQAMIELGPVFVKLGQLLSTRHDLLPAEAIAALSELQDRVPPFSGAAAFKIIEAELGAPIDTLFAELNQTPLASASVAQVHAGRLHDQREIVVKVLRPGIDVIVTRDLDLVETGARWLQRWLPESRRFHPLQVVQDYRYILLGELDLGQEAANASQFRRNFSDSPLLYVPEVHWKLSGRRVLTLERVYGVPVSDTATMEAAGVNLAHLSEIGVEIFFTQVFRDNFFHADMHPGNIMVNIDDPANPVYLSLDCAIAGTLSKHERFLLARQLMAFLEKDFEQIATLMVDAGWVPPHTRITDFQNALRVTLEPVLESPLDEIEFGPILMRLFQTARRFELQALPQFVLLEKTLIHVEGLGRQLYPGLDIWAIGRPLLEQWLRDQVSPQTLMQAFKRSAPALIEQVPHLPRLAWDTLQELRSLSEHQQRWLERVEQDHLRPRRRSRWLTGTGLVLLAVAAGWVVAPVNLPAPGQIPAPAWALVAVGAFLVWRGFRNDTR